MLSICRLRLTRAPAVALFCLFALGVLAPIDALELKLEPVVQGPGRPTGIHSVRDGSGRLFLLSKVGGVFIADGGVVLPKPFLDISHLVLTNGLERGLRGLAFHPEYESNGSFFTMYTDLQGDAVLSRWTVSEDPNVTDPDSEVVLAVFFMPHSVHNCSQLQFGADGYLYIGCGDGGGDGDPDNRAQNLSDLLGKILRIDVDGGFPYSIPPDNPFLKTPGAQPEIWAYGVRNPWRFSFDRLTGDLYMGDVGQSEWEEINFQPGDSSGGENYGWRRMEGNHCYNPPEGCSDESLTLPIFEHAHGFLGECAIAGGFVYRGTRFPRFTGLYFYSDWCSGRVWAASQVGGQWQNPELLDTDMRVTTFGEDGDGELYLADDNDGTIYRLVDPVPFCDVEMSQDSYIDGETATVSQARLVNLGDITATVRLRIQVVPPTGDPQILIDVGADGSFELPAGSEEDHGPRGLFAVNPQAPRGIYSLLCQLDTPGGEQIVSQDAALFEVK